MKINKKVGREYRALMSRAIRVLSQDLILEGTLSKVQLPNSVRHQLTFKEAGRTRTVYVPAHAVAEVERYLENWRTVKPLLKEATGRTLAHLKEHLLKKEAAGGKAGGAGRGRTTAN